RHSRGAQVTEEAADVSGQPIRWVEPKQPVTSLGDRHPDCPLPDGDAGWVVIQMYGLGDSIRHRIDAPDRAPSHYPHAWDGVAQGDLNRSARDRNPGLLVAGACVEAHHDVVPAIGHPDRAPTYREGVGRIPDLCSQLHSPRGWVDPIDRRGGRCGPARG